MLNINALISSTGCLAVMYLSLVLSPVQSACPLGCKNITENSVQCVGEIPFSLPNNTGELILSQIDSREFYAERFCHHVKWPSVKSLIIDSVKVVGSASFNLGDDVFKCLEKVNSFKLSSKFLFGLSKRTFYGLNNVTVFDLSGCTQIPWPSFGEILSSSKNIPKLSHLILSKAGIKQNCLLIDSKFLKSLSLRPLTFLDLSYTCFKLSFTKPGNLCKTLSTFNYAGATAVHSDKFVNCTACNSLRIVDDSEDIHLRQVFHNNPCINSTWKLNPKSHFFEKVRTLYQRFTITLSDHFWMYNCSWRLFDQTKTVEYYFTNNYLPNFDVQLISETMTLIDLSLNKIENIHKDAFKGMPVLRTLNLSYNELSKGENFYQTILVLFKHSRFLKVIDLSSNQFADIPENTFISNVYLKELWLARNKLHQLHFSISHLVNMKVLDLRYNSILYLDQTSRAALDTLFNHDKLVNGSLVDVLLDGNPLSCGCMSLEFLKWFVSSPLYASSLHKYKCEVNGQTIEMDTEAVKAAEEDCRRIERTRLAIILSPTLAVLIILAVVAVVCILYKRHQRTMVHQRFKDGISRLKDQPNRFPVLLSYSSQDSEFVKEHILQQFQVVL